MTDKQRDYEREGSELAAEAHNAIQNNRRGIVESIEAQLARLLRCEAACQKIAKGHAMECIWWKNDGDGACNCSHGPVSDEELAATALASKGE